MDPRRSALFMARSIMREVCDGGGHILKKREEIKRKTMLKRHLRHEFENA